MKRILITGANSYIGTSVEKWLLRFPEQYIIDTIDMHGETWKEKDFSKYDIIFHVSGIAHIKETKKNQELYYKVNRDLAFETAKKAKNDGVKQFIFLSSMSVYGIESGVINRNTSPKPKSSYGKSKFEAEELINTLQDSSFTVSIIRPPMVYGKGCKGNYPRLVSLAINLKFFPRVNNIRSMIYIDNLSKFVQQLIENRSDGLFFPQNEEYVNTSEMVKLIAEAHGKKIGMTKLFNPFIKLLNIKSVKKLFGVLVYDKTMSEFCNDYRVCGLKESIFLTEGALK